MKIFDRSLFTLVLSGLLTGTAGSICGAQGAEFAFPIGQNAFPAELLGLDSSWNLSFSAGGKVRVVGAEDLVYWGRIRDVEAGPQIVLADGGMLRADILLLDEKQIVIGDGTGLGRGLWDESTLPREAVRGVLLQPPAGDAERDKIWRELVHYTKPEDSIWLRGGETISGKLVGAPRLGRFGPADAKVGSETYEWLLPGRNEPLKIPAAKVVAIGFAAMENIAASMERKRVWLGLGDGSLVCARSIAGHGDARLVTLAGGGELKLTSDRIGNHVVYVEPVTERVVWLSDLKARAFKQLSLLSVERPLGVDQCVLERRLRCGGSLFRKGLGVVSASQVTYTASGYQKFEAEIGIDDAAGLQGSVIFKVELETGPGQRRTVYESPVIRGGDAPTPISIDLQGASQVTLVVEYADRGDVCDYANWLNARLVK